MSPVVVRKAGNKFNIVEKDTGNHPALGETRKGTDAGFKTIDKVQWTACSGCGMPRWARLLRG